MNRRVLITRPIPHKGTKLLKDNGCKVDIAFREKSITPGLLLNVIDNYDALISLLTDKIDKPFLEKASHIRGIANFAVGFDNIDLESATSMGIQVSNTPGVLTDATADLAWTLLLATARKSVLGDSLAKSGEWSGWEPLQLLGVGVSGKILAIVGAGRIGSAVAQRSRGFGMELLYVSPRLNPELENSLGARRVSLADACKNADFLSLHLPLTQKTFHIIGTHELSLMKKTAILINTSRGPVVDERALIDVLKRGAIFGAGLDVYEHEPYISKELRNLHNAVLLPHLGSATVETRDRMAIMAAENILAMLDGKRAPNLVNTEVLFR